VFTVCLFLLLLGLPFVFLFLCVLTTVPPTGLATVTVPMPSARGSLPLYPAVPATGLTPVTMPMTTIMTTMTTT
jgi:hypothetical protein